MRSSDGGTATGVLMRAALVEATDRGEEHLTRTLVARRKQGLEPTNTAHLALLGKCVLPSSHTDSPL